MIRNFKSKFLDLSLRKKFIILIAGIATISPIFLIGFLASIYYYIGIESLFNDQVSKAVSDTVNVAKLYLKENNEKIKFELLQIEKTSARPFDASFQRFECADSCVGSCVGSCAPYEGSSAA